MTTPALLLSVTPAFADGEPAAQTQHKPSVAELEKAAAAAKTAYDDAVAAEAATLASLKVVMSDTTPLALAAKAAETAATDAGTAKTEADRAAADAKAAVDGLPATATDAERTAAATTLAKAEAAAVAAGEAKTAADAKAVEADDARDDERVGAARDLSLARAVTKEALAAKTAADEALAEAKELHGGDYFDTCVSETELTAVIRGLPSTVVAGKRVDFTFRVTNGTGKAMDRLFPSVYIRATSRSGHKPLDHLVHLQRWSPAASKWKNVDVEHYMEKISPLKAGAHVDVKMRFTIDASAPAGNGVPLVSGSYWNVDGTCGTTANNHGPGFVIATAGSKPGHTKPGHTKPGTTGPDTSDLTPQSGSSAGPVNGSLAATGSSSATPQFALAGGAAVAIGAGAMFAVRRRKAGSRV
ncbi:LAETG motif-containing sortase-dependent surface protein [Streptomyces sp. NPDC048428]|uniref:LAETG motif-containing sortase-dependent surface protein n=1 Tax=Streptomyces sp. NPDC048428 TaxID=3154503 RepID=UPI00343274D8